MDGQCNYSALQPYFLLTFSALSHQAFLSISIATGIMESCDCLPIYKYRKLSSHTSIRILVLRQADEFSAPLDADLVHQDRQEMLWQSGHEKHYEAISYCWGTAAFANDLLLDGRASKLKISPTVDSMLRHLRKTTKARYLWIDAICLNQADNDEKAVQVQMMGEIYVQAKKVQIWLGESDHDIPKTFALFRSLAIAGKSIADLGLAEEVCKDLIGFDFIAYVLMRFFSRPWFQRRWVLQEAALGHDITARCGHWKIAWSWLSDGIDVLKLAVDKGFRLNLESINAIDSICTIRTQTLKILDLLWNFHSAECYDPRDRFFALYGIAADITNISVPQKSFDILPFMQTLKNVYPVADYTTNWTDTYRQFAEGCLASGSQGALLQHLIGFGSLAHRNPDWPSWIPNWSVSRSWDQRFIIRESSGIKMSHVSIAGRPGLQISGALYVPVELFQEGEDQAVECLMPRLSSFLEKIGGIIEQSSSEKLIFGPSWSTLVNLIALALFDRQLRVDSKEVDPGLWTMLNLRPNLHFNISQLDEYIQPLSESLQQLFKRVSNRMLHETGNQAQDNGISRSYEPEELHHLQAINGLLKEYSLFYINTDCRAVGICALDTSLGDFVIMPTSDITPRTAAFVVRPESSGEDKTSSRSFRLRGLCFLSGAPKKDHEDIVLL
jgi:hypothetical protein